MRTGSAFLKLFAAAAAGIGIGFLLAPGRGAAARRLLEKGEDCLRGAATSCRHSLTDLKHALTPASGNQPDLEPKLSVRRRERTESRPGTNNT